MKISTNTRYALRFLACLAKDNSGKVSTAFVSKQENISEKMLERIAAKLKHAGFVESSRGIGGGYKLLKLAEDITVSDVMHIMEKNDMPLHCGDVNACCDVGGVDCKIFHMMQKIDEAIDEISKKYTIEDLTR